MKRVIPIIIFSLLLSHLSNAQGFSGINTGNYAGISGVMLQPASIVDSRFKFDINLFSTDIRYSNNYFLLNRDVLLKFNKNKFDDYQTFRAKYLSEANLEAGEKAFFNISNRTQLPLSFMATLNQKSAVALNLQSRSMIQGRNISQDLAKLAFNSFYHPPLNNQLIDASGVTLRSLSWIEAGITYGRVLLNSGNHFLKGAVTGKYLGGVSSLSIASNNLTVRVNSDSSFNFNTDRVDYAHNKNADFNKVFDNRFRPDANALGFDAGLVYEYRGQLNNLKFIGNDDEKSNEVNRRDINKYIFKLGVSLLDAGSFRFTKPANVSAFQANITNWDIRNGKYSSFKEFDTALANRVTPFSNDPKEYIMYLPGALSVQLDIKFVKGLYLNALAYRPLKMGSDAGTRFNNYGYYTITPRYEKRHFGLYIPYSFFDRNDITNYRENSLGVALRLGPLFFGSSNLGSMAFNKKLEAADFFLGLKVGFTYGKPSKISRILVKEKEPDNDDMLAEKKNKEMEMGVEGRTGNRMNLDTSTTNRLVVDYSKGQVYSDGKMGQVIIVNNNYYYRNDATSVKDSILNSRSTTVQQNAMNIDSVMAINVTKRLKIDSANNQLRDSLTEKREQLDSLINKLYNLRQKLDSSTKADSTFGNSKQQSNISSQMQDTMETAKTRELTTEFRDSTSAKLTGKVPGEKSNGLTEKNQAAKKKLTSTSADILQPVVQQQQSKPDDEYENYFRLSKRLEADIERLERQIANNRSVENTIAPPPFYNQPTYNNTAPPPTVYYPVNMQATRQAVRDTIIIRDTLLIHDTVFIVNPDTVAKREKSDSVTVYVAVPGKVIVKEEMDFKLPPENILFASGQVVIRQVYIEKLNYLAGILRQNPELSISITGHTDKTGSPAGNELLSLKRANAVKMFFVQKGIEEKRMQLQAVAAEDPLVAGDTNNAKAQNRRVEIRILE